MTLEVVDLSTEDVLPASLTIDGMNTAIRKITGMTTQPKDGPSSLFEFRLNISRCPAFPGGDICGSWKGIGAPGGKASGTTDCQTM